MAQTPHETILVENDVDEVCCDGGNPVLGHPVVWYVFDGRNKVTCHYCDRTFLKAGAAGEDAEAA
jgi:uncharacterized Zn-finger protein